MATVEIHLTHFGSYGQSILQFTQMGEHMNPVFSVSLSTSNIVADTNTSLCTKKDCS
jgi:hypothetical protein